MEQLWPSSGNRLNSPRPPSLFFCWQFSELRLNSDGDEITFYHFTFRDIKTRINPKPGLSFEINNPDGTKTCKKIASSRGKIIRFDWTRLSCWYKYSVDSTLYFLCKICYHYFIIWHKCFFVDVTICVVIIRTTYEINYTLKYRQNMIFYRFIDISMKKNICLKLCQTIW